MKPQSLVQAGAVNPAISRTRGLYNKWAQKHNISYCNLLILYIVNVEGPVTQKKIREDYEMPKQTINNVITMMKREGYVYLQDSTEDKREKKIVLTERGRAYSDRLLTPLFEIERAVAGKMGEDVVSSLIDSVNLYGTLLEEEMKKEDGPGNTTSWKRHN